MSFQIINEGEPEKRNAEYRADPDDFYVISCAGCGSLVVLKKPEYNKAWVRCTKEGCGRIDNCAFVPRSQE